MHYISTRGDSKKRTFSQAVLEGLADDGGLLVPESLPDLSNRWPEWADLDYPDLAFEVLRPLATDLSEETLRECCRSAYGASYGGPVAPLKALGGVHLLELFHGPTLAFKDVALQLLGRLFGVILEQQDQELNIVAATSGDTGSAAIHGLKDVPRVRLFVTHPDGRIAPLQRRQMTTVVEDSVFNIAVDGTFDDCQQMVKELSRDLEFKKKHNIGAVNSINFARIAAQIVYYFAAYLQTPGAARRVPAVVAVRVCSKNGSSPSLRDPRLQRERHFTDLLQHRCLQTGRCTCDSFAGHGYSSSQQFRALPLSNSRRGRCSCKGPDGRIFL